MKVALPRLLAVATLLPAAAFAVEGTSAPGLSTHGLWLFAHLLLFVFWLGADLGVFLCARAAVQPGLTPEQRLRTVRLMRAIELAPAVSASLMLTVGGILSEHVGIPHSRWQSVGLLVLAPVWLLLIGAAYRYADTPRGEMATRLEDALRAALVVAIPISVAWSWFAGRLAAAPYVAAKLLIFAALMALALALRRRLRPVTAGLRALALSGASLQLEATMREAQERSRALVAAIWIGLCVAAWLGIVKPGGSAVRTDQLDDPEQQGFGMPVFDLRVEAKLSMPAPPRAP